MPTRTKSEKYEVVYSADKAEIRRTDGTVETHLEVTVSPEKNVEVRRVTLTNHGSTTQFLELTSYLEVLVRPRREYRTSHRRMAVVVPLKMGLPDSSVPSIARIRKVISPRRPFRR